MVFWNGELSELDNLYESFRGHLPEIVREMEQLIKTEDPNVVMLYSRRCLEVIVTDLCETELKRPRKTEPLKGIIDKLNSEEKVPSHIITSMHSLNSMATYGTHPKDFDPEQVKPVLNNLAIIIKWYLKYKDFHVVSKPGTEEETDKKIIIPVQEKEKPTKSSTGKTVKKIAIFLIVFVGLIFIFRLLAGFSREVPRLTMPPGSITFIDPRDNQEYIEIQIGRQVWMGENLRAVKYNDGTPIPQIKNQSEWEKNTNPTPAYCYYENDKKSYKNTYGPLYNWAVVNTGRLCPVGWHVPTDAEWDTLELFLDPGIDTAIFSRKPVAGIKMKEGSNQFWLLSDTVYGTNESGFTALPAGCRTVYGVFWGINERAGWWSSTETPTSPKDACSRELRESDKSILYDYNNYKNFGFSVRCIKDTNN